MGQCAFRYCIFMGLNHSEIAVVLLTWTGGIRNVEDNIASDHICCDESEVPNQNNKKMKRLQELAAHYIETRTGSGCLSLVTAAVTKEEKWHYMVHPLFHWLQ